LFEIRLPSVAYADVLPFMCLLLTSGGKIYIIIIEGVSGEKEKIEYGSFMN